MQNTNGHISFLYSPGLSDAAADGRYIAYPADGPWHSATDTEGEIRTPPGGSVQEFPMERSPGRDFVLWRQSMMCVCVRVLTCVCLCIHIYFPYYLLLLSVYTIVDILVFFWIKIYTNKNCCSLASLTDVIEKQPMSC